MKRALFALALAGCAAGDPCASFDGQACITVEVRAGTSGVTEVDQLELSSSALHLAAVVTPSLPDRTALPVLAPVTAGAFTGSYSLTVRGKLDGAVVGSATLTAQTLGVNEHTRVTVELQPIVGSPFTVVQGSVSGESLNAIWGADADDIFVVGTNGLHLDYYDQSWHRKQSTLGRDYYAIWGRGIDEVYAVGEIAGSGTGIIEHYSGGFWREEYIAPSPLYGVWGDGTVVLAVGADGNLYGKQVGTSDWGARLGTPLTANPDVDIPPGTPILRGISGHTFDDFVMPAGLDRFYRHEGMGNIINLDPVVNTTVDFRSVWAAPDSPTSVFLGTNYFGIVYLTADTPPPGAAMLDDSAYQLSADQSSPNGAQSFIRGIYGLGGRIAFVGDGGRIYTYDVGPNQVTPIPSPTEDSLGGVWGATLDDVWVVGDREQILHGSLVP